MYLHDVCGLNHYRNWITNLLITKGFNVNIEPDRTFYLSNSLDAKLTFSFNDAEKPEEIDYVEINAFPNQCAWIIASHLSTNFETKINIAEIVGEALEYSELLISLTRQQIDSIGEELLENMGFKFLHSNRNYRTDATVNLFIKDLKEKDN